MATTKNTDPPVDAVTEDQAAEALPIGTVVRLPATLDGQDDRYAVIVGYGDPVVEHTERDHQSGREVPVAAVPGGHPLLLDLPGAPREHQSGIERL